MAYTQILIAGFGGQGILFAGKFLAYKGLLEGKQISWLPSYGPEMRGGTANCSVIISDTPVGSPIVSNPDILVVMNLPSLDKYENAAVPGSKIFVDSALIDRKDAGIPTLANMIMMGKMIRQTSVVSFDDIKSALEKVVSAKHADMLSYNLKALETGYNYK